MSVLSSYTTARRQLLAFREWGSLEAGTRVEAGFITRHSSLEVPGISLVHLADKFVAVAGDRISFSAWILNGTSETLWDVSLKMRSLTNSRQEPLQFETQPAQKLLKGRVLGPRQSLQYSFSYVLKSRDTDEAGELISALSVEMTSESLGRLYSECDSIVTTGQ